jgi:hypothetical protein
MKKILVAAIMLSMAGVYESNAQLSKGNVLIGGDLAAFDLGLKKGSGTNINITPKAAVFIQRNVALGGYLDLGIFTGGSSTVFNYGVGGLGRYYVGEEELNLIRQTKFFLEANAGLQGTNVSGGSSTNGLGLGVGPGLAYFITPNIGLEGLLKYNGLIGFGNQATSSRLRLNVGFQIYLTGRAVRTTVETLK